MGHRALFALVVVAHGRYPAPLAIGVASDGSEHMPITIAYVDVGLDHAYGGHLVTYGQHGCGWSLNLMVGGLCFSGAR